jgi:hypothetical protein
MILPLQMFDIIQHLTRGGTTRWCHVQKITCCSNGSRHQYIVIWWGWHYRIFSVLLGWLLHSWMINGESTSQENIGSPMIDLCHTKRDRKSLQQILQIFIFNVDRLRTLWMKKKMATKCPSRKLQMITFNIQPKHSYDILAFLMVIIRFHTKTYWGSRELYVYKYTYIIKKNIW